MYFTYRIKWSSLNVSYYGVRYCKDCSSDSLWESYFTSSKYVKAFREQHGEPDVIEVRQTFLIKSQAFAWEQKALRRLKVPHNVHYLNRNIGGSIRRGRSTKGIKKKYKVHNPMNNEASRQKLGNTRRQKGLGVKSAVYLKPRTGDNNPMRNADTLSKYKQQITGRKRMYREDGSWYWHKATPTEVGVE